MRKKQQMNQQRANKNKSKKEETLNFIADTYAQLVQDGVIFPRRSDLKELGITRDAIHHHFGTIAKLRKYSKERNPGSFEGAIDLDVYLSGTNVKRRLNRIKKFKRFIITTAVSGQPMHEGFIKSIDGYCKANNAKLLLLPSHDPAHNLDNEIEWHFDPSLLDYDFIFEEMALNSNVFISEIRVTAKQINPVTGLTEISQNKGSFIFASPKQSLEFDSVSANKLPHARMSTGACTLPNYKSTRGNSLRTAYLATFQHVIGAVIVEVEDERIYHFRQIQAAPDGSFCDLGLEYNGSKSPRKIQSTLVMGDYHAGEHDNQAVEANIDIIDSLGVEEVIFHDMFNAASVNPHESSQIMIRAERTQSGLHSLEKELEITAQEFDRILGRKSVKRGVVVKSNHDDMIDRWVSRASFAQDPVNFKIGCRLAAELFGTNKDFFEEGLKLVGLPKYYEKLVWLTVDQDYMIGGVNCGAHGDKGPNGARGSIKSMAKAYPKCIVGHSHTPGIFKGAFQVGTTSKLRLGYNKGPSSWVHSSCLLYPNGQRQLINCINGQWRLKA